METRIRGVLSGRAAPFGPRGEPSGYAKAIRTDRVKVALLGIEGDEQADLVHHGGVDKAVHHYAIDHYPAWTVNGGRIPGQRGGVKAGQ